jgi:hypothetical protein
LRGQDEAQLHMNIRLPRSARGASAFLALAVVVTGCAGAVATPEVATTTPNPSLLAVAPLATASIAVPDLSGLNASDANARLLAAGLVPGTTSSGYDPVVKLGLVDYQLPVAGTLVLAGSAVLFLLSAGPAPAPTPTDTPSATLPDVSLVETGLISFGTHYNATTLLIDKGTSRFSRSYSNICWSASLSQPAGATSLTFIYARVDTGGVETSVYRTTVDVSDPADDLLANCADLATLASNRAGTYVLRYARDATVLADGRFTLH